MANRCVLPICCYPLQAGADVNLPNNVGDTPLHKAAFTGRKVSQCIFYFPFRVLVSLCSSRLFVDSMVLCMHLFIYSVSLSINQPINQSHIDQEVVMLLLHYDACATVINGTAQIPKDVTQNAEIRSMLEGKRDVLSI